MLDLIERKEASCDNIALKVDEKVRLIDQKIQELMQLKEVLASSVNSCSTCCSPKSGSENCELFMVNISTNP